MLSLIIFLSSMVALSIADDGCCECTQTSDGPKCNDECDATICAYDYDPYCCNVQWDSLCVEAAEYECNGGSYDDDGCSSYGDYDDYGYDDQCDCNEICDEGPDEWEFEYEAIPPCVIQSCGELCDKCASDDECVAGIENVVNDCYYPDKDPKECMDELIADAENNGFTQACNGNAECGADLKALGECVANSANYGICSEEEVEKVSLKSLAKTIKIKSRKLKRKSAALKAKSKRSRARGKRSRKVRGKRQSKLRKSRRKLLSKDEYGSDDENPDYDYGCYCDCGEEDDQIPPCITEACGEQLMACQSSQNCVDGVDSVQEICVQEYETPEQCVEELIQDSNGAKAIELCNGDTEAAGDLQALGQCVLNTFNSGDCDEGQYKKLKIKALVKSTKKVRARKVASKQRRSRSVRRARSSRAQRLRKLKLGKLKGRRGQRQRPRSRVEASGLSKSKRARGQRGSRAQRKLGSRSRKEAKRVRSQRKLQQRRKLLAGSTACCDCTESSYSPNCNEECDNTICPYDSYCCNYSWDWICANSAVYECDAAGGNEEPEEPPSDPNAIDCCDCTDSKGTPNCNEGCDATICPYDSYCCNYSWDWICANSAVQECAAAEEIPSDESCCDCTDSKNTPNCNEQCDNTICPYDSYCCNYSWDWICANSAVYECDAAGGNEEPEEPPTTAGGAECCDCTSSKNTPNCNEGCDDTICPYDSYCCNYSWDWICANSAVSECAAANVDETPTDGSCCDCTESKNSPNCNEQCDSTICPYDSYCCNYSWDWICANSAVQECDAAEGEKETEIYPPQSGSGSCCECTDSSDSANCNQGCDDTICPYDPYCCNNKWDWICADSAKAECEAAGNSDGTNIYEGEETNPQQGSDEACCQCIETESTSGCTPNPSCDAIVCPIDSYCCNYSWDGICANGANNICNAAEYWSWPTEEETGSCCDCTEESDSSGCNEVCENEVCPLDSYCCNNKWDWICANGAENICQGYDYFNSDSYGYDDSYNYDYYEPYYSDSYGYDSYNYGSSDYYYEPYSYYDSFDYGYSSDYDYYEPSYSYDSYNYGSSDYDAYEPYSYYGGYDSFNDYGYSSYEPNYYDYSSDYGYSSDYSYYEPSYDYYDSFDYGYSSYEPNYDYYDSYNYGSSDYYYETYSYGGYDSYNSYQDEEDFEDVPECFETICGYQIYQCVNAPDCYQGLEAGEEYCEANHETSEECVETLIQESQSQQVAGFCNGNQTAAGYLQELGQCFLNTITSGECPEEQQKKLKVKAMVKAGKKLKTRKVRARRSKQRKARSSKRQSLRSRSSKLRQQNKRPQRLQSRVRTERQRRARSSKRQKSRKVRSRGRARRSLMAQRQSRARPSGRARSARVQKRRQTPQRSRRVRARGRSRKALAQVQRQRRSRKARRQSKRLRRN